MTIEQAVSLVNAGNTSTEVIKTLRRMRRKNTTAIVHSGGQQTIFGCVCGARHSCATSYRQAKHVENWCEEHEKSCGHLFSKAWDLTHAKI